MAIGDEVRAMAKKYYHNDANYINFLGNLSELFYYLDDKKDEAIKVVKEGRMLAWYKLRDIGIEIEP